MQGVDEIPLNDIPRVALESLDAVWFQVGGTICNLRCDHCFISCTPENDKFKFMTLEACRPHIEEAAAMGVREFYFTGGEPFANPHMCDILEAAVAIAPCTILTNATLFRDKILERLRDINASTIYSIELRVSIDGYNAAMNDPIRGEGTFDRAMEGVRRLVEAGFLPIITITRTWNESDETVLADFVSALKGIGYGRPRLKVLPLLRIGAEENRTHGYDEHERVTPKMMEAFDASQLVCSSARLVTEQGVWVCPILLDSPEARLGATLTESTTDYPLRHRACYTCWSYGAICSNVSTAATATTDG